MPTAPQVLPNDMMSDNIDLLSSTNTFIVKQIPSPSSSGYTTPLSTIIQRKDEALRTLGDYFALAGGPGPVSPQTSPNSIQQLVFQCSDSATLLRDPSSVEQSMERLTVISEQVEFALAQAPANAANPVMGVVVLVPMHTTQDVRLFLDFCRISYVALPAPGSSPLGLPTSFSPVLPYPVLPSPALPPPGLPYSPTPEASQARPCARRAPQLTSITSYVTVFSLAEFFAMPSETSRAGCQLLLSEALNTHPFEAFFVAVRFELAESVREEAARGTLGFVGQLPLDPGSEEDGKAEGEWPVREDFLELLGWGREDAEYLEALKVLKTYWAQCILAVERATLRCAEGPVAWLASEAFRGGEGRGRPRCCNWIAIGDLSSIRDADSGDEREGGSGKELAVPLWYYEYIHDLADAVSVQPDPEEGRCRVLAEEVFLQRTGPFVQRTGPSGLPRNGEEPQVVRAGASYYHCAMRCSTCSKYVPSGVEAFMGGWIEEMAGAVDGVELV